MGWKIGDKITVDPGDNDLVPLQQGENTRNSTLARIKKFFLGDEKLKTTAQTITGAINENTTQLSEIVHYPILLGEIGVVNIQYPYGDVRRYGAIGDGVTDDSVAIANALNQNNIVSFINGKTYLCNNSFFINDGQTIKGNNATILIGSSFAPTSTDNRKYAFLYPKIDNSNSYYRIDDLTINFASTYQPSTSLEFIIFSPAGFKTITLNNVTIQTTGQSSSVHLMYGCSGLNILNNVKLINNNVGKSGGCLWLYNGNSSADAYIYADNCTFYGLCAGEILAIYGSGGSNCLFKNCVFTAKHSTIAGNGPMLSVYDWAGTYYSGTFQKVNVKFINCSIINNYDSSNVKNYYFAILMAGTSNFNKNIIVNFDNCNIVNNSYFPICGSYTGVGDFSSYNYPYNTEINLNDCIINTQGTINGSYHIYELDNTIPTKSGLSVNMKRCKINCVYALFDFPNIQSDAVKSTIEDCVITITSALGVIRAYYKPAIMLNLNRNIVTTDNSVSLLAFGTGSNPHIPIKSIQFTSNIMNVFNNAQLADATQFTALN